MRRTICFVALMLVAVSPAASDENHVYESYDGVTIGRVFLSPAQRQFLDARRHLKPAPAGGESSSDEKSEPTKKAPPPAGFIIGPNGRSRVWKEGDFVDSAPAATREMAFPGEINVVRHASQDESRDDD